MKTGSHEWLPVVAYDIALLLALLTASDVIRADPAPAAVGVLLARPEGRLAVLAVAAHIFHPARLLLRAGVPIPPVTWHARFPFLVLACFIVYPITSCSSTTYRVQ